MTGCRVGKSAPVSVSERGGAEIAIVLTFVVVLAALELREVVLLSRLVESSSVALVDVRARLRCESDAVDYLTGAGQDFLQFGRAWTCLGPASDFRGDDTLPLLCVAERLAGIASLEGECDSRFSTGHR